MGWDSWREMLGGPRALCGATTGELVGFLKLGKRPTVAMGDFSKYSGDIIKQCRLQGSADLLGKLVPQFPQELPGF